MTNSLFYNSISSTEIYYLKRCEVCSKIPNETMIIIWYFESVGVFTYNWRKWKNEHFLTCITVTSSGTERVNARWNEDWSGRLYTSWPSS